MPDMDDNLSRVIAHHDGWAATYDADIAGMILYNMITLDNIRRFVPEDRDGVILDAGGGTGFWAIQLAEMGYRVVLTDISPGMLDKARARVDREGCKPVRLLRSDVHALDGATLRETIRQAVSKGSRPRS